MRALLVLVLLVGGGLAAAWLGGETWLAREAARRIEADPRIESAAVTPLREIDRIGLHLADVAVETPAGRASLPTLDLWAAPASPNQFHATLPAELTVPVAGVPRTLGTQGAQLTLRIAPLDRAVSRAAAASGPVTLDGKPLAQGVEVDARLSAMGAAAPPEARASYAVTGRATGLTPAAVLPAVPVLTEAGTIAAEGAARVWLTGPLTPEGRPRLLGVGSEGVTLRAGDRVARVAGHVTADAEGRAQGAAFIYTADPRAWLDLAAAAGAIPRGVVPLAGTALETAARTEVALPAGVPAPAAPGKGELRIPLVFQDGKTLLGPLPVGPAPVFPG